MKTKNSNGKIFKNLKRIIFTLILLFPFFGKAQAHLGLTVSQIKALHTDKVFITKYTTDNTKYIYTDMPYGTFYYYFDGETGLSNLCAQIPENMTALNAQVEIYNKKYVIISETSWKAYLEGGGIMNIRLTYLDDSEAYVFIYTN